MHDDDKTGYRLTGKGLHALGKIDDKVLALYENLEEQRDLYQVAFESADKVIQHLLFFLLDITEADTLEEAQELAEQAKNGVLMVDVADVDVEALKNNDDDDDDEELHGFIQEDS